MEAVILIVVALFLLGIVLWISMRVRSRIETGRGHPTRDQALNEAEALTRIDHIDPWV